MKRNKYFIKEEIMCNKLYYMIYINLFFGLSVFFERWNTIETATTRLSELNKH
jgi:hypothetical protein